MSKAVANLGGNPEAGEVKAGVRCARASSGRDPRRFVVCLGGAVVARGLGRRIVHTSSMMSVEHDNRTAATRHVGRLCAGAVETLGVNPERMTASGGIPPTRVESRHP